MKVSAIIPAAGQGTRMGAHVPKQFLLLKGKPILHYTLLAFERAATVDSVILVVPESDLDSTRAEWLKKREIVRQVIAGGEKRQDSVYNGFMALEEDTDIVIVHDGVRPFVSEEMLDESVAAAKRYGAAITAVPVSDTVKKVDAEGLVSHTVDRNGLWRVQTPQTFQYALLRQAFEKAIEDSYYGTDEGSLIEYLGEPVKIIAGSELNIKITRKEDLILGEGILNHAMGRNDNPMSC